MDFKPFITHEHLSARLYTEAYKQIERERQHGPLNWLHKSGDSSVRRLARLKADVRIDIVRRFHYGRIVPVYYDSAEFLGNVGLCSVMRFSALAEAREYSSIWFCRKLAFFSVFDEDYTELDLTATQLNVDEVQRIFFRDRWGLVRDEVGDDGDELGADGDEEEMEIDEEEEENDGDDEEMEIDGEEEENAEEGEENAEEEEENAEEEEENAEEEEENAEEEEENAGEEEENAGEEEENAGEEEETDEEEEETDGEEAEWYDVISSTSYINLTQSPAVEPPLIRPPAMDMRKCQVNAYFFGAVEFTAEFHFSTGRKIVRVVEDGYLADIAVVVVSAIDNDIEGQCADFGKQLKLVMERGASQLFVLVKDMAKINWSEQRFFDITVELQNILRRSLGSSFRFGRALKFLPISDLSDGLDDGNVKPGGARIDWWNGPCFFDALDNIVFPYRDDVRSFRMPVVAKYKSSTGTLVMGKVECGTVGKGDSLFVMPNRTRVEVVAVFLNRNEEVNRATVGENVHISLSGITDKDIKQGCVLSCADDVIPAVSKFTALLKILQLPDNESFTQGYKAMMHVHTVSEECMVSFLRQKVSINMETLVFEQRAVVEDTIINNGDYIVCDLKVQNMICVEEAFTCPKLGRLTICSSEGDITAVGDIIRIRNLADFFYLNGYCRKKKREALTC